MPSTAAAAPPKPRKLQFALTLSLPPDVKTADVQRRVKDALADLKPTCRPLPSVAGPGKAAAGAA